MTARWWHSVGLVATFAILMAPSVWMLATIPPLWKDIDAYAQMTEPPDHTTLLAFGPAYCFSARIPLYLGYVFDCWRADAALPSLKFFLQPKLTDSGVFLLVLMQHVALALSACVLIVSVTRSVIGRLVLAGFWASIPGFYLWAHCVSTEALSVILLLILSAVGLQIIAARRRVPRALWLFFAVLFAGSLLTRHVNGVLGALLPLAFALAAGTRLLAALQAPTARAKRLRSLASCDLGRAMVAVLVGLVGIAIASGTSRLLSRAAGISYHSTVGFTFLFRLRFFAGLTAAEQKEFVAAVTKRDSTPEIRTMLELFRNASTEDGKIDVAVVLRQAHDSLPPSAFWDDRFSQLLNRTARACMFSGSPLYLRAVHADFSKAMESTMSQVIRSPIVQTKFFFFHPNTMPQCASLRTFRATDVATLLAFPRRHSYLRWWRSYGYWQWLTIVMILGLTLVLTLGARGVSNVSFAVALNLTGLGMILANCIVNEYQDRYTLPMWELLAISTVVLLGSGTPAVAKLLRFERR